MATDDGAVEENVTLWDAGATVKLCGAPEDAAYSVPVAMTAVNVHVPTPT
jgi:hypothetical protein